MKRSPQNKWFAFWLSAFVPGAGQMIVGHASYVAWCSLVFIAAYFGIFADGSLSMALASRIAGILICLASAEHAKRLCELRSARGRRLSGAVKTIRRSGRAIAIDMRVTVPNSVDSVWSQIANVSKFLTIDPFHERVTIMQPSLQVGTHLTLKHNAFGRHSLRFGKLLRWKERGGYSFSDLSRRGSASDFPHVFHVSICEDGDANTHTTLNIAVRGKWTSRIVPVFVGRWWVWLVCCEHLRLLRKAL